MTDPSSPYSAAKQGLGYIYQGRAALLLLLELPEDTALLIEKDDDVDFDSAAGKKSLVSLKHRAEGGSLTDLSRDFWKSVRIWLDYYLSNGRLLSHCNFVLMTTQNVAATSELIGFIENAGHKEQRTQQLLHTGSSSASSSISSLVSEIQSLSDEEIHDFFSRIKIIDSAPRITDIPMLIDKYLRTVRREFRQSVFERLEGWWGDMAISLLSGDRTEPVFGYEVSDKLSALADEYKPDNLPITFRDKVPEGEIDAANDPRIFVEQLRILNLSVQSIQFAIIDYYRAFEQRSSWARESLLVAGEIEEYESRLEDEWARYKEVVFERIGESSSEEACIEAGKELYRWAELQTLGLRIRERVTEPYVVRGGFHILANFRPEPRVYWHPRFLSHLEKILGVEA